MMPSADIWLSSSRLVGLPGLPKTQRGINKHLSTIPEAKKRKRKARGGGYEVHYSVLPPSARASVLFDVCKSTAGSGRVPDACKHSYNPETLWQRFERRPESEKDRAAKRLEAVHAVAKLVDDGIQKGAALAIVAEQKQLAPKTLKAWFRKTKGVDRADWLPTLLDEPKDGRPALEIPPMLWEIFKGDYLRPEAPAAEACYRRVKSKADKEGIRLPSCKTFIRKISREIPQGVIVLKREGEEAASKLYPSQERDHTCFEALEAVNADGHKVDVFVRFPDGEITRPILHAFQDVMSGKIVSCRAAKTENKDTLRLALGDVIENSGIPRSAYIDNGRAFASKSMTGGLPNRYRFKIKDEDPDGLMKALGIEVHWCLPYSGQSKPIERAFRDFAEDLAKHPAFAGAYTGNSPNAKPENYGSRAIDYEDFMAALSSQIAAHNARQGRRSKACGGILSFDQAFQESYALANIRKAVAWQRRLFLLAAEKIRVQDDCTVKFYDNRYYSEALAKYRKQNVVVRFDPDNLRKNVFVYQLDTVFIGEAEYLPSVGFNNTQEAREHNRKRRRMTKLFKEHAKIASSLTPEQVADLLPGIEPADPPTSKVVEGHFQENIMKGDETNELFGAGVRKIASNMRSGQF